MKDFLKGFEKQANIFKDSINVVKGTGKKLNHLSTKQMVLSGDQFAAKQKALLAARQAERASKTPAAKRFVQSAGKAAKGSVTELSAHAQNKFKSMNGRSQYLKAGLGVNRVD